MIDPVPTEEGQNVELVVPAERLGGLGEQVGRTRVADDREPCRPGAETADRAVLLAEVVEHHMWGLEDATEVARLVTPRRAGEWAGRVHGAHTMSVSAA